MTYVRGAVVYAGEHKGTVPNDVFRMGFGRVSGELLKCTRLDNLL